MNKSIPEIDRVLKKKGMFLLYVYSDVERIDGTKESFITVNEFVNLMKKNNFAIMDIYTHSDEEFDEAAEKHLIIVSKVEKWNGQEYLKNAMADIFAKPKSVIGGQKRDVD